MTFCSVQSIRSPLQWDWSSIGRSLHLFFFSSPLPYHQHWPWNIHLSLSTLFVNALQKKKRDLWRGRKWISLCFSAKTLSLSLCRRQLSCQGPEPHSLDGCRLSVSRHHQRRVVSREEEVSLSAAILVCGVLYWLWCDLPHRMLSLLCDWCQKDLPSLAQAADMAQRKQKNTTSENALSAGVCPATLWGHRLQSTLQQSLHRD